MTTKWMTLAALALALSPTLALAAAAPSKKVQTNATHATHSNQYPDRTPRIHDRGASLPR